MGGFITQAVIKRFPAIVKAFVAIDSTPYGNNYYSKSDVFLLKQVEWMKKAMANARNRHWHKIATGIEITAETEQTGEKGQKQREKEVEELRMFELKQQKKREKHKGH